MNPRMNALPTAAGLFLFMKSLDGSHERSHACMGKFMDIGQATDRMSKQTAARITTAAAAGAPRCAAADFHVWLCRHQAACSVQRKLCPEINYDTRQGEGR